MRKTKLLLIFIVIMKMGVLKSISVGSISGEGYIELVRKDIDEHVT